MNKQTKKSMEERLVDFLYELSYKYDNEISLAMNEMRDWVKTEIILAQEEITISLQKDYKKDLDEILKKKKRELLKTAEVNYQRGKDCCPGDDWADGYNFAREEFNHKIKNLKLI